MLLAISLSSKCVKNPRCSFCYNKNKKKPGDHYAIQGGISSNWDRDKNKSKFDTVCFEYSGYNLQTVSEGHQLAGSTLTMTTMPQLITPTLCGFLAKSKISAISLSYDSEKVKDVKDWVEAGRMIKAAGMRLGCNFLIEEVPFDVPAQVLKEADQLNLLSLKPTGKYVKDQITYIKTKILLYRSMDISVVTDNCLAYQIGTIDSCRAGIDFMHMLPDGTTTPCCFKQDCFLWKGKQ